MSDEDDLFDDEYDDDDEESLRERVERLEASSAAHGETEAIGCVYAVWALGMALAVNISWGLQHSILWATIQGVLSWLYVGYYWFTLR